MLKAQQIISLLLVPKITIKLSLLAPVFWLLLLAYSPQAAYGQRHEFGLGVGATSYKGDLNPGFEVGEIKPGIEFLYRYNFSYVTALRANVLLGSLVGDGANSTNKYIATRAPNSFSTFLFEASVLGEYNFFDFRDPADRRRGTPFLVGGLGFFVFRPGNTEKITSNVQPMIPFGFGYKYRLNKNLNLGAEFMARRTFTDQLDDVSDLNNATFTQRGFKYDKDWYAYAGITLTYTIYTIVCPFDYN